MATEEKDKESIEYSTMLERTVDLISEISADVLSVANELVAERLIPPSMQSSALIQAKDPQTKATELVHQVTNKVKTFPEKFHVFLKVLKRIGWLEELAKKIHENFNELKKQQKKIAEKVAGEETEIQTPPPSENVQDMSTPSEVASLQSQKGVQKEEGTMEMETQISSPSGNIESMFIPKGVSLPPQDGIQKAAGTMEMENQPSPPSQSISTLTELASLPQQEARSGLSSPPPYSVGESTILVVRVKNPISSMEDFECKLSHIVDIHLLFFEEKENGDLIFKFKYVCIPSEIFPLSNEQKEQLSDIDVNYLKCGTYVYDQHTVHGRGQGYLPSLDLQFSNDEVTSNAISMGNITPAKMKPSPEFDGLLSSPPPYSVGESTILVVKVKNPISSMEDFECKLSHIVDIHLLFFEKKENGDLIFKFKYVCIPSEVFPLSNEQKEQLSDIDVNYLKCETYVYDQHTVHGRGQGYLNGNLEIVKHLIEFPSLEKDVDIKNKEGNKPVDIAMKNGHQRIVEELLGVKDESATCVEDESATCVEDESATCDDEDADKRGTCTEEKKVPVQKSKGLGRLLSTISKTITPFSKEAKLMQAARVGNHEEVERLLKMGAKPNHREADSVRWTPLMWASQEGHTETVKCLLQYGADPNKAALNGFTPLILASRTGQCETIKALLDPNNPIKTEVNMRNKTRGWSALMWAAQSRGKGFKSPEAEVNRQKVVEYLLEAGADVNLQADNGWTPLMQASQDGCTELVKILCKTAAIDHQSKGTWTALTTACRKGNTDVIKVLVEAGADINKKKKGGVTSMHIASYKNLVTAMESIVSANADINIKDDWGMTPLILAVKQQNKEMIRYLIKEVKVNVDIVAEKYSQWSALFFAIENRDQDTVDLLLENKADVTIMDEYKHTILSYSKGLFTRKMMHKYLLEKLKHSLPPEEIHETRAHSQLQRIGSSRSVTPLDQALYAGRDILWNTTQRIHITVNTAF